MFQELLIALNGVPGSIFFDSPEGIKISSCIPNLHPAEREILGRLCSLGTKYKFLCEFVKKYKFRTITTENEISGLYLQAFCSGLEVVLGEYQQELVQIEQEILKDAFLPLTHFLKLEKYTLLFQVLFDIVCQISNEKIHGCRILELLFKSSSSGVVLVEVAMNKIMQHCHSVMYRQVFYWMMNGYIEDPYNEFFIQPENSPKPSPSLPIAGSLSAEKNSTSITYKVKPQLLPSYIPSSLAAKILFVGEYVAVLGTAENSESYSLFLKKEHVFAKKFERLSSRPLFSLLSFETTIDDIKRCAAERLWEVIVKQANVVNHLKIMKDFYLLGRGELFLNFINEANNLLRMPVTTTAESDASKLFQIVARRTFLDDDVITDKFHVTLQAKNIKSGNVNKDNLSKAKLETGWSSIGLYYDIPHPLHILITPSVIDKYNMIFRFLLSVRRVQIELHKSWALQMQIKGAGAESRLMPFWQLRSHMSFLIDNFQYYILVDVLESCFSSLTDKLETVKDFEEIQQYHNRFLTSVISQCFLELWTVHHSLEEILELCSSFCTLVNRVTVTINPKDVNMFENIKSNFQRQTSLLFRILSGVRSHQVSPHLAQLLLRIDYNKYLTSCGGQLGGSK
ncbi:Gamma-tubulin complex component 4 [Araneus ventricosus]|uniref:Gamma-tubulin complex component n=1 Tax=Araneus ventricosus TaxID=182803 RepID=A0A4Y2BU70_ARAVE|nr:Gamma-tubulin complex component 4 [Araneus ventricosus]